MSRRKDARKNPETPVPVDAPGPSLPRVLIVSGSRLERMRLASRLCDTVGACVQADSVRAALEAAEGQRYDVALIGGHLPQGAASELARELGRRDPGTTSMLVTDNTSLEQAVEAMRSGVVDIVPSRATREELAARVRSALGRGRVAREREERIERLTRVCRQLNSARHEITRQVSGLCGDLANAYQDLSDQVILLSTASEFNSLIRQELDVESLLRTALEFVLAKTGPTNAAVFLPATTCDFSLGAYVNYDCPGEAADTLLEGLAGVVAPKIERETGLRVFNTAKEIESAFGEGAHWLSESHVVAFSCRRDGECLAVVVLFRDRRNAFPDTLMPALSMIAELFGKQLARVIHVHHRHLPKDQWGGFGTMDGGDDDIDLAA